MDLQRKQHWDNVYSKKENQETSWFQEIPETSLRLVANLSPGFDSPVIDVGGGNSNLTRELYRFGYRNLTVLDISGAVIEKKQAELENIAQHIVWEEGDVLTFNNGQQYQLWHDRAVFHFFTKAEEIQRYVEVVEKHVAPKGYVVISTFSESGPEKCSGLPVARYSVEKLNELFAADFDLLDGFEETHETPFGTQQDFVFVVFLRKAAS
jgi:SAM-dependent methyltransferase